MDDFWSALDGPSAAALAARATRCSYTRGRALVHEGQVPDRVFVLQSGCAKVTSITTAGREVVLAFRGPGALVGEQSALDGEPRSATIVAIQPVDALVLSHRAFVAFLLEQPTAHLLVTQMLARRLRESDAKVMLATATTITRVAARLLELSERFGSAGRRRDPDRAAALAGGDRGRDGVLAGVRRAGAAVDALTSVYRDAPPRDPCIGP